MYLIIDKHNSVTQSDFFPTKAAKEGAKVIRVMIAGPYTLNTTQFNQVGGTFYGINHYKEED